MKFTLWAAASTLATLVALPAAQAQTAAGHAPARSSHPVTATATSPTTSAAKPTGAATTPRRRAARKLGAASSRVDGIAAVVNDDVILESDVEEQLYLFLMQAQGHPDSAQVDTLRHQVLDQLIDFKLIVGEAKRQGITLTAQDAKMIDAQVDKSIDDTRARFDTEEAYQAQLTKENTTEAKLREKYRSDLERQLLAERLVEKALPKKSVTAAEAEAFFKSNPDKFPHVPAEVKVQVIQIAPHPDSTLDARGKAKVLDARKRLVAGESFAKVAESMSEDPNTQHAGGDLGFLPHGALDPPLDEAVFSLKLNDLSPPIHSAVGWHIIQVLERDTLKTVAGKDSLDRSGQPALEAHVRHILVRVPVQDVDIERARSLANRVHAEALKGADFGTLVRRYSQYDGKTAGPDGDLGFVSMGAFQPTIRAGLDSVAVGHVTDVLDNAVGYNIFKINDRKPERPYQLDEVRDQLPDVVGQIQQRNRYDTWVKGLRAKAHIEIRSS